MKVQQSGTYTETFHRFGELWWQSTAAKDVELAEKLEAWIANAMRNDGWTHSES
jgi:hypothetical protein